MKNKINDVLVGHFGLDLDTYAVHFEIIYKKDNSESYNATKLEYEKNLAKHEERAEAAKRLYVCDEFIIHVTIVFHKSEVEGLASDSAFYYPICTYDEIKRIESVSSAEDYLLKIRADNIADHARLARIFLSRREASITNWSLTSYYDSYDFDEYISRLPKDKAEICSSIVSGYVLSREPQGACINTAFGKVVVVSESLRHFLFYMNAHLMGVRNGLTYDDWSTCLFIAIRTMLLTETPDFDMDPRGDLPAKVEHHCNRVVDNQIQFVIGHEYAHALLGHFGPLASTSAISELLYLKQDTSKDKIFTPRQEQEFDADAGSILHADYSDKECSSIMNDAVLFFLSLDVFYSVSDYINPPFNPSKTHPDPIDRLWAMRNTVLQVRAVDRETLYSDKDVFDWIESLNSLKRHLVEEMLPYGIEHFEMYGSNYLPSFRNKELFDRFDF